MPSNRISRQTFVGNCLEEIVGLAVEGLDPPFDRSPTPPAGMISPDFLRLQTPAAFIAVTATPTRNTFQKKKWRYVHEVFSNRQYYHTERPLAINIQLSQPGAIQGLDRQILDLLFDYEINVLELPSLGKATQFIEKKFDGELSAKQCVSDYNSNNAISELVAQIRLRLQKVLGMRHPTEMEKYWRRVEKGRSRETCRVSLPGVTTESNSNLRAVCFGLLLLNDCEVETVLSAALSNCKLPERIADLLQKSGVPVRRRISGFGLGTDVFAKTIQAGFEQELILGLIQQIRDADELEHVLVDLRSNENASLWATLLLDWFKNDQKTTFVTKIIEDFDAACRARPQTRLEVLDYALIIADWSITEMDRVLANRFDDLGHGNRTQCMISARCPMRSSFSTEETQKVAERTWEILRSETDILSINHSSALDRILAKRQATLKGLGGEANPVEILFRDACKRNGVKIDRITLPCLFTDCGLSGRGSRVERIYHVSHEKRQAYVKVLSGYQGGFEHKAEELAGRGWIIRYRNENNMSSRSDMRLVFVWEGEWTEDAIEMICKSGWDEAINCLSLLRSSKEDFIKMIMG
jgi:hypothetical protein